MLSNTIHMTHMSMYNIAKDGNGLEALGTLIGMKQR